jgi:GLPGLI family protein
MKRAILVIAIITSLYNTSSFSQCTHIIFEDHFFRPEKLNCTQHKLFLPNNKALSFYTCEKHLLVNLKDQNTKIDSCIKPFNFATIFDLKNQSFIELSLHTYNKYVGYTDFSFFTKQWKSQKKAIKNETGEEAKELFENAGFTCDNYEIQVKYLNEEAKIGDYKCKKALLSYFGDEYTLWYTTEIQYNKAFLNFLYKVPGTVIQIENNEKIVFKLISVGELNIEKTDLSYELLFKLLCGLDN